MQPIGPQADAWRRCACTKDSELSPIDVKNSRLAAKKNPVNILLFFYFFPRASWLSSAW